MTGATESVSQVGAGANLFATVQPKPTTQKMWYQWLG